MNEKEYHISELIGKTITQISGLNEDSQKVRFITDHGDFLMYHRQDCCESVTVEDVCGDVSDLISTPILMAEERTNSGTDPLPVYGDDYSFTWTFYELRTIKGSVTIRWYGSSNGYYSESVGFYRELLC